jgi:hypothetical protein
MTEVYSNSYCTLSALSSQDVTEGCQGSRSLHCDHPGDFTDVEIASERADKLRFRIFRPDYIQSWSQDYDGRIPVMESSSAVAIAPLRHRAWALQEKELSRQVIHFSRRQLLWECRELRATAQLPWRGIGSLSKHKSPDTPTTPDIEWFSLVTDYTDRSLTIQADRLPALSGLARNFQTCFPTSQYAAGMWSHHLPHALLWSCLDPLPRRTRQVVAPSWSWASLEDAYPSHIMHTGLNGPFEEKQELERGPGHPDIEDPTLLQVSTQPRHDDRHGAITSGQLVLTDALVASVDLTQSSGRWEFSLPRTELSKYGQVAGSCFSDTTEDLPEDGGTYMLPLYTKPSAPYFSAGLLLARCPATETTYRRLGKADTVLPSVFQGCVPCDVTLV